MGEEHSDDDDDPTHGHVLPDEVEYPEPDGEPGTALPRRIEGWRRRSATGAMLTGFAFGLREAFEVKRDEPAVMLETSGVPPKDLPVEADMDDVPPRQSVVRIRRWLLPDGIDGTDGTGPEAADGDPSAVRDGAPGGEDTDADPTVVAGRAATAVPARSRRPAPRPNAPRRAPKRRR